MHPTPLSARRLQRVLAVTLTVIGLVGTVFLTSGSVRAALKASHPTVPSLPAQETLVGYQAYGANNGKYPLTPHYGAVITNPDAKLIFEGTWTTADMQKVKQYFIDVSGSAFEGILTQYTDIAGSPISNTITLSGSVMDPNFYHSTTCGSSSIFDTANSMPVTPSNDIFDEIVKEMNANNWTTSSIYFVFTAQNYPVFWGDCSTQECGYHSNLGGVTYAVMAWDGGPCAPSGVSPVDVEINTASHEQFEAITDPFSNGWADDQDNCGTSAHPASCEIGDKCGNGHYGVSLNGHDYPWVQGEFSNATLDCEYSPIPTTTCAATIETDNIEPGGTYTDNRGNTWHVYYDIKRDSATNRPCQMRVVVRIFNPAPDGTWSGTTGVFAEVNGGVISASIGKVSSSCTYQYHLVWRGPWFTAGPDLAYYHIEDTEYNGSNPYIRAYADFTA